MIHPTAVIGDPPESRDYWFDESAPTHAPVIHETARVHAFVSVDAGMHQPTTIGAETWLGKHVHVGHDAVIGAKCELAPGVVVCGHVEIGDGVKVGVNACIRPFVKVGHLARIGCGAVVIRDVLPGQVVAGNPAKPIVAKGQYVPPDASLAATQERSVREGWDLIAERSGKPVEAYR